MIFGWRPRNGARNLLRMWRIARFVMRLNEDEIERYPDLGDLLRQQASGTGAIGLDTELSDEPDNEPDDTWNDLDHPHLVVLDLEKVRLARAVIFGVFGLLLGILILIGLGKVTVTEGTNLLILAGVILGAVVTPIIHYFFARRRRVHRRGRTPR